ncbi:phospholipase domain-containing protein [Saccharopolyspora sp. NPDC049426]|uniref:phospholipase domain-containing protein n=1 Tax=Saccharopolyspora sp. NPDC049426 TaxID=3155652 RepID=UPI00341FE03B
MRASSRSETPVTERLGVAATSQPQVGGVVDGEAVSLRLGYVGPDFARFAIRNRHGEPVEPSHVDVLGEKFVAVPVTAHYQFTIEGPGDIRMELSGSLRGHAAAVDVQARHTERGLTLELRNNGPHEVVLDLRALAHAEHEKRIRVAAGGAVPLIWPAPHGHYGLEVTAAEDETFHRRIVGEAEPRVAE